MSKLTKWAETIVWKGYPDCKPEKAGVYIVKFANGETGGAENINGRFNNPWGVDIIAYAVMPTGSIGDEFGFETAMLLMKEGLKCQSVVDGTVIFMEDGVFKTNEHNNIFEKQLWSDQILGKWRLA